MQTENPKELKAFSIRPKIYWKMKNNEIESFCNGITCGFAGFEKLPDVGHTSLVLAKYAGKWTSDGMRLAHMLKTIWTLNSVSFRFFFLVILFVAAGRS